MKPIITFDGYKINKLNYHRIENGEDHLEKKEGDFKRYVTIGLTDNLEKAIVILNVTLEDLEKKRFIECEVIGEFSVNIEGDTSTIEEVLAVNGVALVYPYVRTIISMVSTLDSDNAIVIPTINTKVFEKEN